MFLHRLSGSRLSPSDVEAVLEKASVPEHSIPFMRAMSGGEPFLVRTYLFFAAEDWIVAIGYPISSRYDPEDFEEALSDALSMTHAKNCWAVSPSMPARLKVYSLQQDHYYTLKLATSISGRNERLAERARVLLQVDEGRVFTPQHRKLWVEFLGRPDLPSNVRELFARTESVIPRVPDLSFLNAWDKEGHLAACLLLDSAPRSFVTYLIGAYSRTHYTAHASDLLFHEMIQRAKQRGKEFLHLGLGINEGIRRFKTKWGGMPDLPYEYAGWQEKEEAGDRLSSLMRVVASMPASRHERTAALPRQKRFAMLYEVEKRGKRSWLGGTAHFFCYSFGHSLKRLFERVDTVLFEGPLDQASLALVSDIGRNPLPESPRIIHFMSEEDVRSLERVVCGPAGFWPRLLGLQSPDPMDVRYFLSETRPWMGFFSIWSGFLEHLGWTQSVDLEAWDIAHEMGKTVHCMETIPEQIETLESIPIARIVNFFRKCRQWKHDVRRNKRAYLRGDIEGMFGTTTEFPSRTELVIHRRDAAFLSRMHPYLEEGRCAVLVGSAHLLRLRPMLMEEGFDLRRRRC